MFIGRAAPADPRWWQRAAHQLGYDLPWVLLTSGPSRRTRIKESVCAQALGFIKLEKKSFPSPSTTIKAGKSSTSICQIASMSRSSYSRTSTCVCSPGANALPVHRSSRDRAAVLFAGLGDLTRAVAFGQHDHTAAVGLKLFYVAIHATVVVGPNDPDT